MQHRKLNLNQAQDDFINVLYALQKDTAGFTQLSAMLKNLAGINLPLNEKNLSLMAGRLIAIMRKYDMRSYQEYIKMLSGNDPEIVCEFISRLTTNTTEFFREDNHFNLLRTYLGPMMSKKTGPDKNEIRVWCAACSSGQEAYTIVINILESMPARDPWRVKMLATDIDLEILEKAMKGVYTIEEIKGVPAMYKTRYFTPISSAKNERNYRISKEARDLIQFASFNLITPEYPFKHPFDVIFCRNVFIYFDKDTQAQIINRLAQALRKGGYLFLGHSESGMVKSPLMKTVSHAVYQRI